MPISPPRVTMNECIPESATITPFSAPRTAPDRSPTNDRRPDADLRLQPDRERRGEREDGADGEVDLAVQDDHRHADREDADEGGLGQDVAEVVQPSGSTGLANENSGDAEDKKDPDVVARRASR